MKYRINFIAFLLLVLMPLSLLTGQNKWDSRYIVKSLHLGKGDKFVLSLSPEECPESFPFSAIALGTATKDALMGLRLESGEQQWNVQEDAHLQVWEQHSYSRLYFVNSTQRIIKIVNLREVDVELDLYVYLPYQSPEEKSIEKNQNRTQCEQFPPYKDRKAWCPSGDCPYGANRVPTTPTHLIVHHSAGTNTSSDWDAVVRSIWHYHVITRGWDDIGYNWLVAPNGQLYEGRGDGIKGAHFCGYNSRTMGVCMMGTYSTAAPKDTAVKKLEALLTWTAFKYKIKPMKRSLHTTSQAQLLGVSGHRDRCNTECPGNVLYTKLSSIRAYVAANLEACGFKQGKADTSGNGGGSGGGHKPPKGTRGFYVLPTLVHDVLRMYVGTDIGQPLEIALVDASGRRIWYEMVHKAGSVVTLNMRKYPTGVYIIHASNPYKSWTVKIHKN